MGSITAGEQAAVCLREKCLASKTFVRLANISQHLLTPADMWSLIIEKSIWSEALHVNGGTCVSIGTKLCKAI